MRLVSSYLRKSFPTPSLNNFRFFLTVRKPASELWRHGKKPCSARGVRGPFYNSGPFIIVSFSSLPLFPPFRSPPPTKPIATILHFLTLLAWAPLRSFPSFLLFSILLSFLSHPHLIFKNFISVSLPPHLFPPLLFTAPLSHFSPCPILPKPPFPLLWDSYPAFFLPIATISNKNF